MCALSLSEKIIVRRKVSGVCYVLDPDLDGNTSAESLETIYLLSPPFMCSKKKQFNSLHKNVMPLIFFLGFKSTVNYELTMNS